MVFFKKNIYVTFFMIILGQNAFSEVISLYCQGRYQTGELLQLRLDFDLNKSLLNLLEHYFYEGRHKDKIYKFC